MEQIDQKFNEQVQNNVFLHVYTQIRALKIEAVYGLDFLESVEKLELIQLKLKKQDIEKFELIHF